MSGENSSGHHHVYEFLDQKYSPSKTKHKDVSILLQFKINRLILILVSANDSKKKNYLFLFSYFFKKKNSS